MNLRRSVSFSQYIHLRPISVRLRLTLWNVAGLAVLLLGLGTTLRYTLQSTLNATITQRLIQDSHRFQEFFAHHPPPDRRQKPHPGPPPPRQHSTDVSGDESLWPRTVGFNGRGISFFPGSWDPDTFPLSLRGQDVYSTIQTPDGPARILSVPLRRQGRIIGALQVGVRLTEANREVSRLTHVLLTLIPLALLIAGVGGALLTGRTLQPVRQMTQAASRIEAQDLSGRLPVVGNDEFGELALTFNGMLNRLDDAFLRLTQSNEDLTQANHRLTLAYEQQRRFTADASHELRTPLGVIKANTSLALLSPRRPEEDQETLEAVDRAVNRMIRLVQDLLLLARSDAGHLKLQMICLNLWDVLDQALEMVGCLEDPRVCLTAARSRLCILGNADSLTRLFGNLLANALRHTPPEGQVVIAAEQQQDHVVVTVTDTGSGILPEHLPHLFERFYRADTARSEAHGGTGLGLAICQSIAEAHGGTIRIESAAGTGTTVTITLPSAPVSATAAKTMPESKTIAASLR